MTGAAHADSVGGASATENTTMAGKSKYPAYRWHPQTKQRVLVEAAEDDDKKFLDHHPDDKGKTSAKAKPTGDLKPAKTASNEDEPPMTRDEIKAALDQGRVKYAGNASNADLYALLCDSLRAAIERAGKTARDDASALDMLEILRG